MTDCFRGDLYATPPDGLTAHQTPAPGASILVAMPFVLGHAYDLNLSLAAEATSGSGGYGDPWSAAPLKRLHADLHAAAEAAP